MIAIRVSVRKRSHLNSVHAAIQLLTPMTVRFFYY